MRSPSIKVWLSLGLALSSSRVFVCASPSEELSSSTISDDEQVVFFSPSTNAPDLGGSEILSSRFAKANDTALVVPNAYIVRLKKGARLAGRDPRGQDVHARFHKRAAAQDLSYSTRYEFEDSSLFFGLSIQLDEHDDTSIQDVRDLPEVEGVWPVGLVERPVAANQSPVSGHYDEGDRVAVNYTAQAAPGAMLNEPHVMTDVDRVHELGIKGKGVRVVVIDTGVDYNHPALGGCFGEGCRISFGYDFVGDTYDSNGVPVEDPDPLSTCPGGGSGTHALGIIGAVDPDDSPFGLLGVAPEAELGMYRAFDCTGGASLDILMKALERTVEDKVDVVSLSGGFPLQFASQDPFAEMTASLAAKGILIVMPAGNQAGNGKVSAPAVSKDVIAVGSIENVRFPAVYTGRTSNGRSFKYSGNPWPIRAHEDGLIAYDLTELAANTSSPEGCSFDAYSVAADAIPDLDTAVLLIPITANCAQGAKLNEAVISGFKHILLYATGMGLTDFDEQYSTVSGLEDVWQMASLSKYDGETIISGLGKAQPGEYKLYFNEDIFETPRQIMGGLVSNFSATGPSLDTLIQKPQVSGPGGNILSTWPLSASGYALLSGTSQSSAFVAGAVALLKSQFPNAGIKAIRSRLQASSTPVGYYADKDLLATTAIQGTGLINVWDAIHYESVISPSELTLGDHDGAVTRTITIKNRSSRTKTYKLGHEPAALIYLNAWPLNQEGGYPDARPLNYPVHGSVSFPSTTVTIGGGQKASVRVTLTPPRMTPRDISYNPVYSGYITATNNNDKFFVSYIGMPYSRGNAPLIDTSDLTGWTMPLFGRSFTPDERVTDIGVFSFNPSDESYTVPKITLRYTQVTQHIRFEYVPYNTSFVPNHYGFGPPTEGNTYGVPKRALPMVYPDLPLSSEPFSGLEAFGVATEWIGNDIPTTFGWPLRGQVVDQATGVIKILKKGDYRFVIRVLKWNTDPEVEESWDSWMGPVFRVPADL